MGVPISTYGGLTFYGDDTRPATYTIWKDGLKGWFSGVEMRHESIPRPNGDGDFDAPGRKGPRIITQTGLILADGDPEAFENAMSALGDMGSDGSKSEFAVQQATGTFGILARMHGEPEIIVELYGSRARYRFQLWAPLPAKYEVTP